MRDGRNRWSCCTARRRSQADGRGRVSVGQSGSGVVGDPLHAPGPVGRLLTSGNVVSPPQGPHDVVVGHAHEDQWQRVQQEGLD